jgi:glucose-1-phosphate cytidylyltransferase
MRVVILAGGLGTRISEETETKPKPMVLLDDKPIIWHLMSSFAKQGLTDFILATGYKKEVIFEWVEKHFPAEDQEGSMHSDQHAWDVLPLDTGLDTQTGGRIKKCMEFIGDERILVTYGDGLANVDLKSLIDFHNHHGKIATVTAVRPPARFGYLKSTNGLVSHFGEKIQSDEGWINGGYFILEPEVVNFIHDSSEPFELHALPRLVKAKELMSFEHRGFWQPMDTLRERNLLAELALENPPPWLKKSLDE